VVILVVVWLNAARMLSVFDNTDKFGAVLLLKLAANSHSVFSAFQQTACFVASQTGNLDRVLFAARLSKSDVSRYRRLAITHAILCWVFMLVDVIILLVSMLILESTSNPLVTLFAVHVFVPDQLFIVTEVITGLLFLLYESTWFFFSLSVNYYSKVLQCTGTHGL